MRQGVVYHLICQGCKTQGVNSLYVGESARTMWDRGLEHSKAHRQRNPESVLVEHEVAPCLFPEEHGVPAVVNRRIIVRIGVLVSVDLRQKILHDLLRHDGLELTLLSFVTGPVLPAPVKEAHQLPHLVVVELHGGLLLLLLSRTARVGRGSGCCRVYHSTRVTSIVGGRTGEE